MNILACWTSINCSREIQLFTAGYSILLVSLSKITSDRALFWEPKTNKKERNHSKPIFISSVKVLHYEIMNYELRTSFTCTEVRVYHCVFFTVVLHYALAHFLYAAASHEDDVKFS